MVMKREGKMMWRRGSWLGMNRRWFHVLGGLSILILRRGMYMMELSKERRLCWEP